MLLQNQFYSFMVPAGVALADGAVHRSQHVPRRDEEGVPAFRQGSQRIHLAGRAQEGLAQDEDQGPKL